MKLKDVGFSSLSASFSASLKLKCDVLKPGNVKENEWCKSIIFGDVFFLSAFGAECAWIKMWISGLKSNFRQIQR